MPARDNLRLVSGGTKGALMAGGRLLRKAIDTSGGA